MTKQTKSGSAMRWTAVLLASTAIGGTGTALAQQRAPAPSPAASSSSNQVEEVIVTAQKREESLQNVPESVQAIPTVRLEQMHIGSFNDYAGLLPSLSYTTVGPGFERMNFRGVSAADNGNHSASLPTVGIYLDEQPVTTITGPLDVHIYDIARIEALAGPQGTLFGASSEAGTVRIITNQPNPSAFAAGYDVEGNTVAHGTAGGIAQGFINVPIASNVAVRVVGWYEHDGGYIDNVRSTYTFTNPFTGPAVGTINNNNVAKNNYNSINTIGMRAALRVELADNWTVTPQFMGQNQSADGFFAYDPHKGRLDVAHYYPETSHDNWYQAALTVRGAVSNLDVTFTTAYLDRIVHTQSDYQDYGIYYIDQYKTGYAKYFYDNSHHYINPGQAIIGRDGYGKYSSELRIATPAENRLRFIGGAFYQYQLHRILQRYIDPGLNDTLEVGGVPDEIWLTSQNRIDRDYALFGELSYDITPQLTLTAGLRGFRSVNELEGFYGYSANFQAVNGSSLGETACFAAAITVSAPCQNLHKSVSEDGETHRLNLAYHLDTNRMIYATYSTGFRPGGINRKAVLPPYHSDTLSNYEAGWKTEWDQGHFRWNGAVFWEDWKNFQYSVTGQNGLTTISNIGGARIRGIESDITWRPDEHFTLTGAGTFLHGETTSPICNFDDCSVPANVLAPKGQQLPITPDFKANLTARYEFGIGNLGMGGGEWNAFAQGSVEYQSRSWGDLRTDARNILGRIPASTLVNFSAGLEHGDTTLTLFVNNAFDDIASVTRFFNTDLTQHHVYIVPSQPQTIGIRLGQRF
jgi:outer membrane receptor protein involved in Fe transport